MTFWCGGAHCPPLSSSPAAYSPQLSHFQYLCDPHSQPLCNQHMHICLIPGHLQPLQLPHLQTLFFLTPSPATHAKKRAAVGAPTFSSCAPQKNDAKNRSEDRPLQKKENRRADRLRRKPLQRRGKAPASESGRYKSKSDPARGLRPTPFPSILNVPLP